jgi:hypothetical protein
VADVTPLLLPVRPATVQSEPPARRCHRGRVAPNGTAWRRHAMTRRRRMGLGSFGTARDSYICRPERGTRGREERQRATVARGPLVWCRARPLQPHATSIGRESRDVHRTPFEHPSSPSSTRCRAQARLCPALDRHDGLALVTLDLDGPDWAVDHVARLKLGNLGQVALSWRHPSWLARTIQRQTTTLSSGR